MPTHYADDYERLTGHKPGEEPAPVTETPVETPVEAPVTEAEPEEKTGK